MKQRKYMLLAMLAAAALIMTACSNKKADVDTAEAQESPDAYVTEEETGEGDGIYMYKPIAADAFTYDIAQTDLGDQTFTLKNVSDQSYSYVSADILFYNADDEIMDYYQGVSFSEVMAGGEQIMRIAPALAPGDYDHLEVLFTGMKKDSTAAVDPSGLIVEKQAKIATDQIIAKMVGRELTNVYPPKENKPGEVIMEVKDLCSIHEKSFQHVSFELRKGEILGFGGLVGAQRTELMEGIFGIRGIASGEIYMHGKKTRIKHPIDAMNAGIGLITEDRRGNGIFGCLSIKDNVGVSVYNKFLKAGFVLDHKKINQVVDDSIKKLSIKTPSMKEHIANLSGGNQQKVIVARWLANDPDVLIMDEPTRGIDVGAKHEIYEIMSDLAKQGKAIIMISSEMSELLGMADRICVMCNGKLTGEIDQPEEMTQARVMGFATKF